ncbi:MAG TPA: inner membrane CreD family protein [Myxococcota bacterium]|nr:inner membrane CreD family protein [Myxococcota bacterium]
MNHLGRLIALAFIFLTTSVCWLALSGVTWDRSASQRRDLSSDVADLWGRPLDQRAPALRFEWVEKERREERYQDASGAEHLRLVDVDATRSVPVEPDATRLVVDLHQDVRRKGLVWFPLYDVDFAGTWTVTHGQGRAGTLVIPWRFPDPGAFYDNFHLRVDGVERQVTLTPGANTAEVAIAVQPGQTVTFDVTYRSRGDETWTYLPYDGVGELRDFSLAMTTDFDAIDYPAGTLSPSTRDAQGDGWHLTWSFDRMITGKGMGMVVPCPIQPGELASAMSLSAPISLLLFMVWIHALGLLRGIDVHPVNHALLAAAFFSFHLLFAYVADHLPVEQAFAVAAVTSVVLVVTYLYRVVSPRFALVEAGGAQLVYLVGFAAAHFLEGFTGLTVTVIGIATLFALMQLTSHVRWTEAFAGRAEPA